MPTYMLNAGSDEVSLREFPGQTDEVPFNFENMQMNVGDSHGHCFNVLYPLVRHNILQLGGGAAFTQPVRALPDAVADFAADDQGASLMLDVGADFARAKAIYNRLLEIYCKTLDTMTREDFEEFYQILEIEGKLNSIGLVRLMGDLLAERARWEMLTFMVLKYLTLHGCPLEILWSNHDAMFMLAYVIWREAVRQNPAHPVFVNPIMVADRHFYQSLENTRKLLEKGAILFSELCDSFEKYYLPHLQLFSYSVSIEYDRPRITIYSHGIVGIETIASCARNYGIAFNKRNQVEFLETLDRIIDRFKIEKASGQFLQRFDYERKLWKKTNNLRVIPLEFFMLRFAFNRVADRSPQEHLLWVQNLQIDGCDVEFMHGHDGQSLREKLIEVPVMMPDGTECVRCFYEYDWGKSHVPEWTHVYNTDRNLGKHHDKGLYFVIVKTDLFPWQFRQYLAALTAGSAQCIMDDDREKTAQKVDESAGSAAVSEVVDAIVPVLRDTKKSLRRSYSELFAKEFSALRSKADDAIFAVTSSSNQAVRRSSI